nr:GIY-YIG nuclease family protein [Candidatus Omnitrophota bacterium]
MWHVYIIQCKDRSLYTGITTDIPRRLNEHNSGIGGRYTRIRMPVKLLYKENYPNRSKALKREIKIKTFSKQEKFSLIERRNPR